MISVRLCGGLGNTLFQYGLGRALAARGKEVVYEKFGFAPGDGNGPHHRDKAVYGLDGFGLKVPLGPRQSPEVNDWRMRYDPTIFSLDQADLYGHWQSDKYLAGIETELRKELVPILMPPSVGSLGRALGLGDPHTAAVHVRRGDYTDEQGREYHGVLSGRYYAEAARKIYAEDPLATFYIFSDDARWCLDNLSPDWHYCGTGNRHHDMWLSGQCRHHILANSSFGWWASFLADRRLDRIVVAPGKWVKTDVLDMADIFRAHWTRIWDDSFFE